MSENDLLLEALRRAHPGVSSSYARTNCPYCPERAGKVDRKNSLSISLVSGWFRCWRCGAHGHMDLPEDMRVVGAAFSQVVSRETVPPPENFLSLTDGPGATAISAEPARTYLRGRGLVDEGIWRSVGIGCCLTGRFSGRVVVPVLAPEGEWLGWVARTWAKTSWKPYLNAPGMHLGMVGALFNEVVLSEETEAPALVVEGVFDALAFWPAGVAVLGKPTDAQVSTLRAAARPVVIVLDGDAWEEAEQLAFRLRFEGVRAGWVRLPPCTDPDEVDKVWLLEEARHSLEV